MLTEAINLAYNIKACTHGNEPASGIIHIGLISNNKFKTVKSCKIKDLQTVTAGLTIHPTSDYYITANPTTRGNRRTDELYSLNNIVIDIDCHTDSISTYDKLQLLQELDFAIKKDLCQDLQPNISVMTGRGLQLWYCLEETAPALSFLYRKAVKGLIEYLKTLETEYPHFRGNLNIDTATSGKLVGYYRYFDSYNTKTGLAVSTTINHSNRYNLNDIITTLQELNITARNEIIHSPTPKPPIVLNDCYKGLNYKRLDCIEWLISNRNAPTGTENRDLLCFAYYNAGVQVFSRAVAKKRLQNLNRKFKEPLEEKKINDIINYIDKKGYLRFTTDNWYSFINMTADERTEYNNMRKNKRNYTRDKERKAETKMKKDERNATIAQLKRSGMTNTAIAEQMGLSPETVGKVCKQYSLTEQNERKLKKIYIQQQKKDGVKVADICNSLNISLSTYKRLLKEINEENEQIG